MGQPVRVETEGRVRRARLHRRARRAVGPATAIVIALGATMGPAPSAVALHLGTQVLDLSSIQAEQHNVIAAAHQGPLSMARFAVADLAATARADAQTVSADKAVQVNAMQAAAAASARLQADRAALTAAVGARVEADRRLGADRDQMRVIAVGMYTGALTNPQPDGLQALEADQAQLIDAAEVEVVAGVVNRHLHADLATSAADRRHEAAARGQVALETKTAAEEAAVAAGAASRTVVDQGTLAADQGRLGAANRRLDAEEANLASALASVAGPVSVPAGQLSLLGGSALSAAQLAGWFNAQGYVDLTSVPIEQLAGWYIQAGGQEGVRGDVAFAQAVLETGGFSSPDAVGLSNFAGIGHCDTCAAGWAFPSPQAGVLGQVQLLRIFADRGPGPAHAPPPVLADLVPSRQGRAGCCPAVESLTGVWATDPTYAQQILQIYGQMLGYAISIT